MRNNPTAYAHPAIVRKIKLAALRAFMAARKPGAPGYHRKQYVENRKGHNIMRIDYHVKDGFTVWGDQSRDITKMILPIIGYSA